MSASNRGIVLRIWRWIRPCPHDWDYMTMYRRCPKCNRIERAHGYL